MLRIIDVPARLPPPDRVGAILAASLNAVRALPATHRTVPLVAVGDATAAEAVRRGFRTVRSASGDARALAALAARTLDPSAGPILLPTRRHEGLRLAADLRARGFRVLRRVVYDAVAARSLPARAEAALAGGRISSVLFFSASAAGCFARLVRARRLAQGLAAVEGLTISRAAAARLAGLPLRRVRVAARPDQESLLALLERPRPTEGMGKGRS